jgi:hypothetical protein
MREIFGPDLVFIPWKRLIMMLVDLEETREDLALELHHAIGDRKDVIQAAHNAVVERHSFLLDLAREAYARGWDDLALWPDAKALSRYKKNQREAGRANDVIEANEVRRQFNLPPHAQAQAFQN